MSKRPWVVVAGFLVGLLVVGGLYELSQLVSDYASLASVGTAPGAEVEATADGIAAADGARQGPSERPRKGERRRVRKQRRAEVDPSSAVQVASAEDDPQGLGSRAVAIDPGSLAEANRPDVRALRRRARLQRRGTRIAPAYEGLHIDREALAEIVPNLDQGELTDEEAP